MVTVSMRRRPCYKIKKWSVRDTRRQSAHGRSNGDRLFHGLKAGHVYASNGEGGGNGLTYDKYGILGSKMCSITRIVPNILIVAFHKLLKPSLLTINQTARSINYRHQCYSCSLIYCMNLSRHVRTRCLGYLGAAGSPCCFVQRLTTLGSENIIRNRCYLTTIGAHSQ